MDEISIDDVLEWLPYSQFWNSYSSVFEDYLSANPATSTVHAEKHDDKIYFSIPGTASLNVVIPRKNIILPKIIYKDLGYISFNEQGNLEFEGLYPFVNQNEQGNVNLIALRDQKFTLEDRAKISGTYMCPTDIWPLNLDEHWLRDQLGSLQLADNYVLKQNINLGILIEFLKTVPNHIELFFKNRDEFHKTVFSDEYDSGIVKPNNLENYKQYLSLFSLGQNSLTFVDEVNIDHLLPTIHYGLDHHVDPNTLKVVLGITSIDEYLDSIMSSIDRQSVLASNWNKTLSRIQKDFTIMEKYLNNLEVSLEDISITTKKQIDKIKPYNILTVVEDKLFLEYLFRDIAKFSNEVVEHDHYYLTEERLNHLHNIGHLRLGLHSEFEIEFHNNLYFVHYHGNIHSPRIEPNELNEILRLGQIEGPVGAEKEGDIRDLIKAQILLQPFTGKVDQEILVDDNGTKVLDNQNQSAIELYILIAKGKYKIKAFEDLDLSTNYLQTMFISTSNSDTSNLQYLLNVRTPSIRRSLLFHRDNYVNKPVRSHTIKELSYLRQSITQEFVVNKAITNASLLRERFENLDLDNQNDANYNTQQIVRWLTQPNFAQTFPDIEFYEVSTAPIEWQSQIDEIIELIQLNFSLDKIPAKALYNDILHRSLNSTGLLNRDDLHQFLGLNSGENRFYHITPTLLDNWRRSTSTKNEYDVEITDLVINHSLCIIGDQGKQNLSSVKKSIALMNVPTITVRGHVDLLNEHNYIDQVALTLYRHDHPYLKNLLERFDLSLEDKRIHLKESLLKAPNIFFFFQNYESIQITGKDELIRSLATGNGRVIIYATQRPSIYNPKIDGEFVINYPEKNIGNSLDTLTPAEQNWLTYIASDLSGRTLKECEAIAHQPLEVLNSLVEKYLIIPVKNGEAFFCPYDQVRSFLLPD